MAKLVSTQRSLALLSIAILPYVGFLLVFVAGSEISSNPIGNLDRLQEIVSQRAGDTPRLIYSFIALSEGTNSVVLTSLVALGSLALLRWRALSSQLALIFLGAALVGFLVFSNCCAYDVRNGLWIYSFLFASFVTILGSEPLVTKFNEELHSWLTTSETRKIGEFNIAGYILPSGVFAICAVAGIVTSLFVSDDDVQSWSEKQRWKLVSRDAEGLLKKARSGISDDDGSDWALVSVHNYAAWLPGYWGHFVDCPAGDTACVENVIRTHSRTIIYTPHTDKYYNYPKIVEQIPKRLLLGKALRRDRTPYFPHEVSVYGPFSCKDYFSNRLDAC